MSNRPTMYELYLDSEKEELLARLQEVSQTDIAVPIQDLLTILEASMEVDLTALIIEILTKRVEDVDDQLMVAYKQTTDVVKKHIVTIFSYALRSKYMQFLLNEYFYNPYMRPIIRQLAFGNKKFLFMNLVRFFEEVPINYDNVLVAQQILRMVPRDVILKAGNVFSGTRLLDVYYAMPPEERKK